MPPLERNSTQERPKGHGRQYGGSAKLARGRLSSNGNHVETAVGIFPGNGIGHFEVVAVVEENAVRVIPVGAVQRHERVFADRDTRDGVD